MEIIPPLLDLKQILLDLKQILQTQHKRPKILSKILTSEVAFRHQVLPAAVLGSGCDSSAVGDVAGIS